MAFDLVYADRVKETSTTTGTGTLDLAGAVAGFQGFVAGVGDGNECVYCCEDGTDYEIGIGTVTDAATDTLSRTVILVSSNSGSAVNWGAGTKNVFVTYSADQLTKGHKGYLNGLTLSNNGTDSDHDLDIAAGVARDEADTYYMELASTLTKQIDATFAAGSAAGGMFTGTVAADTWYHVHLIRKDSDGAIDAGFDTSVSAANIPSGYTAYRRIGSVLTGGSANILPFLQRPENPGWFYWQDPIEDYDQDNIGTSSVTVGLSVPVGLRVMAYFTMMDENSSGSEMYIRVEGATDSAPTEDASPGAHFQNNDVSGMMVLQTDSSGQVFFRSNNSGNDISVFTYGWFDSRGIG